MSSETFEALKADHTKIPFPSLILSLTSFEVNFRLLGISVICLFTIVHDLPAQQLGFSLRDGKESTEFPIEICNNLIVIPVTINKTLPLKFILDTGVRTAILTEKSFADLLNLSYNKKYELTGVGSNKSVAAYITNNVSIDLPGIQGRGLGMLVLNEDILQLRNYLGMEVHGILGYELFSRFVVKVDYANKTLTIMNPHKFKSRRRYDCLSMIIEDTKPYINANVETENTRVNAKLLVDTGASHSIFLESTGHGSFTLPSKHIESILGRGLGGEITGQIGVIESISLGRYQLHEIFAGFPDTSPIEEFIDVRSNLDARDGALGGELLSRFTVIFNFSKEEIYIRKNSTFKRKSYFDLSGITVSAHGPELRTFIIKDVRQNSPAAHVGIFLNDTIVNVNGRSAAAISLSELTQTLNSKPGKVIRLKLKRNGHHIETKFKLTSSIS